MVQKRRSRRVAGAIRKLPSGRYQARFRGEDGRLQPAPVTFATKADADLWLASAATDTGENMRFAGPARCPYRSVPSTSDPGATLPAPFPEPEAQPAGAGSAPGRRAARNTARAWSSRKPVSAQRSTVSTVSPTRSAQTRMTASS